MEQPYFQRVCVGGPMPVCDDVSARMMSLPLFDTMSNDAGRPGGCNACTEVIAAEQDRR